MSHYLKLSFTALFLALAVGILCQSVHAQAVRSHEIIVSPVDTYVTPGDGSCISEVIHFLGSFRTQVNIISTPTGGLHISAYQAGGALKGVGETTGDTYKWIGPSSVTVNFATESVEPVELTLNNRNIFVGPGQDAKLFLFTLTHLTFDPATGQVKVEVSKDRTSCK